MLHPTPDLLTVRRTGADYHVKTWHISAYWPADTAGRESLHSALARHGWRRVTPCDDGDALTGNYRRHAS